MSERVNPSDAGGDQATKKPNDQPKFDRKDAHIKTLDDLVNVNSLFTLAVFVGLTQAAPGARSLENRVECNAGPGVAKMLILYEVVAFACFLLSSLVAKVLKLILSMDGIRIKLVHEGFDVKDFLLILTASASVSGIVLLTLSVVNLVQIRIGVYSCGSAEARRAIWALCTIVGIALIIYVVSIIVAIYASIAGDKSEKADEQV
ncbi:uncharacterized protein LOC141693415 [Apium graveolens]|uniref:uncharacterized protein LOC141693415 n=1 Tax=Apium graveolens TaxID=4045 RepID=UPI003D7A620A